jgi:hypothetical protein
MTDTRAFYLARAAQSDREANETLLTNVRDRHLRAAEVWRTMADRLLYRDTMRTPVRTGEEPSA